MRVRRLLPVFVVALLCSVARIAWAQEEREPVHVEYVVSDTDCPDQARFVAELTARTSKVTVVETGERRRLHVEVVRRESPPARGPRVRGTLTLAGDGKSASREVLGQSCAEVVSALALVAALAIDPHASTKPAPELAPDPAPPPPDPPPPDPAPLPVAPTPEPAPPPAPAPVPPRDTRVVPLPAPPASRLLLSAAARGGVATSPLPNAAPEIGGFVEAAWVRPSIVSPSARLDVYGTFGQTVTSSVSGVSASIGWTGARLSVCPLRTLRGAIAIAYCGVLDAGVLTAHADGLVDAQKDSRVVIGLGGSASARWTFAQRLFLGADLGLHALLERPRFHAAGAGSTPALTLYELPSMGGSFALFVGFDLFS